MLRRTALSLATIAVCVAVPHVVPEELAQAQDERTSSDTRGTTDVAESVDRATS